MASPDPSGSKHGDSKRPSTKDRPRQVTLAGWIVVLGSVFVVVGVFQQVAALDSLETRRAVEDMLSEPPGDGLGLEVPTVLTAIRVLAMVAGACAAATAILGWQVLQGSRTARLVLSVLVVPMFLSGIVTGGFLTSMVAAATVVLWFQPARAWVNGDPLPEPPSRPGRERPGGQGAGDQRPTWPPPLPEQQDPSQPAPPHQPGRPGDGGTPSGPAPYAGFGAPVRTAAPPVVHQPHHQPHQPPYGAPSSGPGRRGRVPGPLRTGLVLTWATCLLVVAGLGLSLLAMVLDPSLVDTELQRAIDEQPALAGEVTVDAMRVAVYAMLGGFVVWALVAAGLGVLAWRGQSWAWVLLCVSAGTSALLFLVLVVLGAFVFAILMAASAGALALLLRPEVREWYRGA